MTTEARAAGFGDFARFRGLDVKLYPSAFRLSYTTPKDTTKARSLRAGNRDPCARIWSLENRVLSVPLASKRWPFVTSVVIPNETRA
jgi:hypothetical protein